MKDKFNCKHIQCDMDGCYCGINMGKGYNHCVIPHYQESCDYFEDKNSAEEKQINESAKVIRPILKNRTDIKYITDLDRPIAEELLKHYQPKLPEDSVVLSADEFANLKKYAYKKGSKETAEKIYRELQGHGTTYVKKWIEKQFGVEIKE